MLLIMELGAGDHLGVLSMLKRLLSDKPYLRTHKLSHHRLDTRPSTHPTAQILKVMS